MTNIIKIASIAAIISLSLSTYSVIQQPVTAGNINPKIAQAPAPSEIKNLPRLTGKATVVIKVNNQPITID